MFELFTERARQVIVLAQEEARTLRHDYIGTEHLLLGLIREETGRAAFALRSSHLPVTRVRPEVVRIVGTGTIEVQGVIPFTPRSKTILERALQEAAILTHDYVGTEHILLALARENDGVAARVLLDLGVTAEDIISRITDVLAGTTDWGQGTILPNDLAAQPPPPAATNPLDRPSDGRTDEPHRPTETIQREQPVSPSRRSALAFEYGPATAETRQRIQDRCDFEVRGDKVALPDRGKNPMAYTVFLRVNDARMPVPQRELAIAQPEETKISPSATGYLPFRTQSGAHLVVDQDGLRAVILDPFAIDGNDVRPGMIAGLAVEFRDITAVEVRFIERDLSLQPDELRRVRRRPSGVRSKEAWELTLQGYAKDGRDRFTVEIELDDIGSRLRKASRGTVAAFYRQVGDMWAQWHLQHRDLNDDQRVRLARIRAGDWEHVVTWIRAIDSGSFTEGHEDELVHTEWLLASLDPPINGTLGFNAKR